MIAHEENEVAAVGRCGGWVWVWGAGLLATLAQLWLVAAAGTDVPFMDQWDAEGGSAFPAWASSEWRVGDLFAAHNEHRIVWTRLLNLSLFAVGGQWDPLAQLVVNAGLKGAVIAALAWLLMRETGARARPWIAAGVGFAGVCPAAWHNALWGFQSSVYFSLLFSLLAMGWLGRAEPTRRERWLGLGAGAMALLAMGAGAFTPLALLGLACLRWLGGGVKSKPAWVRWGPAAVLLVAAWAVRAPSAAHVELVSSSPGILFTALGRAMAWPHTGAPVAALAMNAPVLALIVLRLVGKRPARPIGDVLILLWGWATVAALAMAWTRGGGAEFALGVPSRYADFLVLLPVANAGCAVLLAAELAAAGSAWRAGRLALGAWGLFLLVGWAGLSSEAWRRVIRPRMEDRDAPVRLTRAFAASSGDANVFAGQPRLLVPHPAPEAVWRVLNDPRMAGRLPPSLQPERKPGGLARAVRWLLGRADET